MGGAHVDPDEVQRVQLCECLCACMCACVRAGACVRGARIDSQRASGAWRVGETELEKL